MCPSIVYADRERETNDGHRNDDRRDGRGERRAPERKTTGDSDRESVTPPDSMGSRAASGRCAVGRGYVLVQRGLQAAERVGVDGCMLAAEPPEVFKLVAHVVVLGCC